jgi:hypothetical protein
MFRSDSYSALSGGDSTDFAAFPSAASAQSEEFADFSSAFGQSDSHKAALPASVAAAAAETEDLFGDFGSSAATAGTNSVNGGLDLFGALSAAPAPAPVPFAAPAATPMHFAAAPTPSLLGFSAPVAAPAASSLDLLGGLDLGASGPSVPFAVNLPPAGPALAPLQPASLVPTSKCL